MLKHWPSFFLLVCLLGGRTLNAKPLLIAAGGYGSCPVAGSPSEMPASKQIAELAKELGADLLKTCFALSPSTVFHRASWTGKTRRQSVASFLKELSALSRPDGVFLVGQSYGGWFAMKMALALPPALRARALATVDPISPVHCAPAVLMASFVAGPNEGCTQAPLDLRGQFNEVRSRTKAWAHFYQTDFRHLHSSAITEADRATKMEYPPTLRPFGGHWLTETDPRIWAAVTEAFRAN